MKTQLRHLIADALYRTKAHTLPSVCERFGLASGTGDEAFSSKTQYVMVRLEKLSDQKVLEVAKQVIEDYPYDKLRAAIEQIEQAKLLISDITRTNIVKALNQFSLGGNRSDRELLAKFWPAYETGQVYGELFAAFTKGRKPNTPAKQTNSEILAQAGFLNASQGTIFDFLSEVLSPARRSVDEQQKIITALNPILERDGYRFSRGDDISGYPTFKVVHIASLGQPADELISEILSSYDPTGVHEAWAKALGRRDADPEGAITAAKSLLETVCKHILDGAGIEYGSSDDLPKLYNAVAEHLGIAPSQHSEQVFRSILGNCQSVVGNLAGLRNKLGDSHGQGKRYVKPLPRHAELAVNLAGSMAMFLIRTWEARQ